MTYSTSYCHFDKLLCPWNGCMYEYMYICIQMYMCMCMYVFVYECMYVYMYEYVCIYVNRALDLARKCCVSEIS